MKKLILIIAALFLLSGCATEEEIQRAYEKGYEAGYLEGSIEGHDEGYEEGYEVGYEVGYEEPNEEDRDAYYAMGYKEGHAKGQTEGYWDGYREGEEQGKRMAAPKEETKFTQMLQAAATNTSQDETDASSSPELLYIANKRSGAIHMPYCSYLPYEHNRVYIYDESDAAGYRPCEHCH